MRSRDGASPDRVETVIGRGTSINGKIAASGTLRIEGRVQGTIQADGDIIITEHAQVEAELRGRQIAIAGQVKGNVFAGARLELVGSGKLFGDFHAPRFVVAEGAAFEGHSHMTAVQGKDRAAGEAAPSREP